MRPGGMELHAFRPELAQNPGPDSFDAGRGKVVFFFLPIKAEVAEDSTCVLSSTDETLGSRVTTLTTEEPGSARVEFSLLGWIPLKTVEVRVENSRLLIPGGQSIGLTLFTDGVFIVDSAEVYLPDGTTVNPARDAGLSSGDLIKRVNGASIDSMQDLTDAVRSSGDGALTVEYVRDGQARTPRPSSPRRMRPASAAWASGCATPPPASEP